MKVLIVYATETGAAEALAYSTYQELYFRGVTVSVKSAYAVKPGTLAAYDCVIFIVSTAAYGEFPHSLQGLICKLRERKLTIDLKYTLFGLGDSRYPLFNHAARKLITVLDAVGATTFYRVAYGDEQHPLGHLGEFIAWIAGLKDHWNLSDVQNPHTVQFSLAVETLGTDTEEGKTEVRYRTGTVISNDVITSQDHFRSVRNVVIDCNDAQYTPGDVCCLYPTDDPDDVANALIKLGYDPNETVIVRHVANRGLEFNRILDASTSDKVTQDQDKQLHNVPYVGRPIKLKTIFSQFLSLNNVCTQWQMYIMAMFTGMEIHKSKLLEMARFDVEGCAEYNRYCKDERRSLFEVLCDFNSVRLPVEAFINIATPYYPRMYSIASTPNSLGMARAGANIHDANMPDISYAVFKRFIMHERQRNGLMELCIAEVSHSTPYNRKIEGQASKFLAKALPKQTIRFDIVKSKVAQAVLDVNVPVLFICTGTGLAAIKPLLEGRIENFVRTWNNHFRRPTVKDLALFGFRRRRQDHLYLGDMRLLRLWCDMEFVYSRETGRKVYVQDVISKFSERVIKILMGGLVIISGKSHPMPKQVIERLRDMLVEKAGFGTRAADKFIEGSLMGGKIIVDSWG
ncbi:flavodoxin domain containing protein [Babesia divergens]|uniref:Flavodoxin domain containing protein n=1 Tax=Babesia divergens TaxID=32595 RepID=A0AAD9GCT5_BABDI|nr:flavodoxin domain containing protein [Babesia divergens]